MSPKLKIGVALSGGKDSSLAAALLAREGHQVVGYHLLLSPERYCSVPPEEQAAKVREVGERLRIEVKLIDGREGFRREVMDAFAAAYRAGETPNPCVLCNRLFKFGLLFETAEADGCRKLATGHYARTEDGGRPRLLQPIPPHRDETYFLFAIPPGRLDRLLFPLGGLPPEDIRKLFRKLLPGFLPLPVSQEACFLSRTGLRRFLEDNLPRPENPGEIVDVSGTVLGEHPGFHFYTIGQRKGLSSASGQRGPLYVIRVVPESNRVVVGDKTDLLARRLRAVRPNWISIPPPNDPFTAWTKIRYTHPEAESRITPREDGSLGIEFTSPQEAPTPGQAVVFYRDDILLGGAWIKTVD